MPSSLRCTSLLATLFVSSAGMELPVMPTQSSEFQDLQPGKLHVQTLEVPDPAGTLARTYVVQLPRGYSKQSCLPLVLYFHGTCDNEILDDGTSSIWSNLSNQNGFIYLKPIGLLNDAPNTSKCRSWNVGSATRTDVCNLTVTQPVIYESCRRLNATGPCNCYTCYDDVAFVNLLIDKLKDVMCIDATRIHVAGASNGGIFAFYLAAQLVRRQYNWRVSAIASWYGGVFAHMEDFPPELSDLSLMFSGGLQDVTVPLAGGQAYDGYLYEPGIAISQHLAELSSPLLGNTSLRTPYDGLDNFLGCRELRVAKPQNLVWYCTYNESHGFWNSWTEDISLWFFKHASLNFGAHPSFNDL
eukprot:TRINITY_DN41569_c0_g1_i1.p1 TRINITY_DN41569_c0_g1~~TRINITY_DN41569_c0_g1_i1.p1  ORF type:complete len:356 (-),score=16.44 TRINITY_DN41569_c0_g1_i1:176-1243(-)